MTWLSIVWSYSSVLAAIVGGFALGALVLWKQSPTLPVFRGGITLLVGSVFFSGQIITTLMTEPASTPRVTSRFFIWIVFSVAVGIGSWVSGRRWHKQQVEQRAALAIAAAVPPEPPIEL